MEELKARKEANVEKAKLNLLELQAKRRGIEGGRGYSGGQQPQQQAADQGQGGGTEMVVDQADAEVAQAVADMYEGKQKAFLNIYMQMQAAKNPNGMGMFLPSLLTMSKSPDTGVNDITKVGTAMVDSLTKGLELARERGGGKTAEDSAMSSLVLKLIDKLTDKPAAQQQSGTGGLTELIKSLADAGLVYTHKQVTDMRQEGEKWVAGNGRLTPEAIELERMRMNTDVQLEQIRNTTQMELAKLGVDSKRTDAISGGLTKLISATGRALAQGEMEELEEHGHGMPAASPQTTVEELPCPKCGKTITIPEPEKERDLTCIHCGVPIHWKPNK
jgi:DNA-directed RNA polymerase subunit RPC12/RpoP